MASLRKRKDSNVWQAQYYVADPDTGGLRQVRQSTGHTNKKKAMACAVELERAAQGVIEAGSDKAQLAKAVFSAVVADIERETLTGPAARKYLGQFLAIATGETLHNFTIETWVAEWLRRKRRDSSKATMARYDGHLGAFLSWLGPDRSKKPLESVTPLHVRQWRESLQDAGRAGKTVLAYLKDLGGAYRAAIREGLVSFNPCAALEAIDTSDSMERKPFTLAEVSDLLAAAPSPEWHGLMLVAAFTGLRLGDAAKLSWQAVDLAAKQITLIPSKTKKKKREVRIPIHPDLLAYLENAPVASDSPTAPVFSELSKLTIGARTGLSQTFNGIMQAAGVDRGQASRTVEEGQATVGRVNYERGFHSLRHTFTSWLRNAGVSEEDRMSLTGHSTRESHQIYSHASDQAGRDAISKLPTLKSAKS
ncbi:MAG: site-specific integrase [Verrucomicrobiota bacterium]